MTERQGDASVQDYARLLSLAVHELKTPASVVAGYLRMLGRDTAAGLDDRQRKMVADATTSCTRLIEIIEELSEVGKLDLGQRTLSASPFDLFPVVSEVVADPTLVDGREVHVVAEGDAEGAAIRGDRPRMAQALRSAIRAVAREQLDGTRVVVERRLVPAGSGAMAWVVVAREDALDAACAASRAPVDESRGGLGLAIPLARRIIEHHGGRIWSPASATGQAAARSAVLIEVPLHT